MKIDEKFSKADILEGLWAVYRDFCKLQAKEEGLSGFRLPDYEAALKQLEAEGLPDNSGN